MSNVVAVRVEAVTVYYSIIFQETENPRRWISGLGKGGYGANLD